MISLENFLLLLILSILSTYTFMSWPSMQKVTKSSILLQFLFWTFLFALIVFGFNKVGFIFIN